MTCHSGPKHADGRSIVLLGLAFHQFFFLSYCPYGQLTLVASVFLIEPTTSHLLLSLTGGRESAWLCDPPRLVVHTNIDLGMSIRYGRSKSINTIPNATTAAANQYPYPDHCAGPVPHNQGNLHDRLGPYTYHDSNGYNY